MPEPRSNHVLAAAAVLIAAFGGARAVPAAPIGFNTALPISKGEILWRMFFVAGRAGLPGVAGARARTLGMVDIVGYGIDPKLALFAALPVADRRLKLGNGGVRSAGGIDDLSLFARWTLFARDAPGRTWRIAPFFGVKLATGEHRRSDGLGRLPHALQPGSGSTDPFFGLVMTRVGVDGGYDLEWRWDLRTASDGIDAGDGWRVNGSWQRRIATIGTPSRVSHGLLYGLIELGYAHFAADHTKGDGAILVPARHLAVVRPGLQFAARHFILESAFERPFARSRIIGVPHERWRLRAGVRMNF